MKTRSTKFPDLADIFCEISRRAAGTFPAASGRLITAAFVLACAALPAWAQMFPRSNSPLYNPRPDSGVPRVNGLPPALRDVGIDQNLNQQVPLDLVFRDESGRVVPLGEYFKGKPVILSMVYYECPMLCTQVLNGLTASMRVLGFNAGQQYEVVTVSFDPREGPELAAKKKAIYLDIYKRPGAADGWHFLTGDETNIKRLADAVGFRFHYDPETGQFAHASGIMILTPEGRISSYYYGIEYSAKDMRLGLVEASAGKIGNPVDQLLLYCYHYDPATGRYGAVVMNMVRLGGILTIAIMGTLILVLRRRGATRQAAARAEAQLNMGGTA